MKGMGDMDWHLLNQHYVSLDSESYRISVLEEVLSSDLQLVQVLVSGMVSLKTMISHGHRVVYSNLLSLRELV